MHYTYSTYRRPYFVRYFVTRHPRGGADADVPTQPASHEPRRLRPNEMRSRRRVAGSVSNLKLFSSPESRLRIESDTADLVSLFFSRAQRGLSSSPTTSVVAA